MTCHEYHGQCARCAKPILHPVDSISTGYGVDASGVRHCFLCCGERDRAHMIEMGRATLYLSERDGRPIVTNWPGTLNVRPWHVRTGRHNMAGKRYDVTFAGPDGFVWRGTTYGDNTQICHCRRTRERLAPQHAEFMLTVGAA